MSMNERFVYVAVCSGKRLQFYITEKVANEKNLVSCLYINKVMGMNSKERPYEK